MSNANPGFYIVLDTWDFDSDGNNNPNRYLKEANRGGEGEWNISFTSDRELTAHCFRSRAVATRALFDYNLNASCHIVLRINDEEFDVSTDENVVREFRRSQGEADGG